jgi:hypothetical protein
MKNSFIQKNNVPGPSCTNHPNVPDWTEAPFLYQN